MQLTVISPERQILSCEVSSVELPGAKGRFEILPGHYALLSSLVDGVLRYNDGGAEDKFLPVSGGFVEVKDDTVTVCVG